RWAAEAFGATAGATITTAPLMAYHFGTVSIVSLAANVIGEPLIGPIVWLGSLAAAIGQFSLPLGALLNAPNEFLLGSLISVAHTAASLPGAQVEAKSFGTWALVGSSLPVLVAAGVVHGMLPVAGPARRLRAVWSPLRGVHPLILTVCSLAPLTLLAWTLLPAPSRLGVSRPSIVFLDVGQGDAALLMGSGGCEALIDGGPPGKNLPSRLRSLGVGRLELMVATHPQLDHDGGLGEIARAGSPLVDAFLDGGGGTGDPRYAGLVAQLRARRTRSLPAEAGASWSCGDLSLSVLGPDRRPPGAPPPADPNTRAAVTLARAGPVTYLSSGDAEGPQLLPLALPPADVLKIPHHGSADPMLPAVLRRVRPRVALIGVGAGNRYGHPAPQALQSLADAGVPVYRTDMRGDIAIGLTAKGALEVVPLAGSR
ncbi:MAG: ComEC/Rec2 family competence protein, partial [Solirubrobacterales bacterium]